MTAQRETMIWGPVVSQDPLWKATLGTGFAGKGIRPVLQKTHALRTLVQDAEPSPISIGGASHLFHRPRLLQAAVEPRKDGWNQLVLGNGRTKPETIDLRDLSAELAPLDDVLLAPRDKNGDWNDSANAIETPPFGLVAGGLRVWIPLAARTRGGAVEDDPWLGYAKVGSEHRLLNDARGSALDGLEVLVKTVSSTAYLPAELTAEGLEFFARVPDPMKAFDAAADKIWARVRLFERSGSTRERPLFALAFEGACLQPPVLGDWKFPAPAADPDHANLLESSFARIFADAKDLGVRIDFDRRPAVPPFYWELETKAGADRPVFPQTSAGWSCLFDEALFRITVLSTIDGMPAAATLRCETARLDIVGASARIAFASDAGHSGARTIPLTSDHADPHWKLGAVGSLAFAAARLPLAEPRKRLSAIYAAAKLIDPAVDTIIPAFLPIEHGWLQIPLRAKKIVPASTIERSVIEGTAAFALDAARRREIEVGAASAFNLKVEIERQPNLGCKQLDLAFDDAAGRLRGLVHIADNSPEGGEILPRLRPGATREWPVLFGQGDASDAIGVTVSDPTLGKFGLDLAVGDLNKPETLVVSWQRDGAWITVRNFAQTRGSGRPVAARGLVPRLVKTPCNLTCVAGRALPALTATDLGEVWDAFLAPEPKRAEYETAQIQPAVPGIERYGILSDYQYSLRLDLPPLDDLFANMQISDTPLLLIGQKDKPDLGDTSALASAAAPGRLRDAWRRICDNDRLARTRYRYAFERVATSVSVQNIAVPFVTPNVTFRFDADNGKKLPLGSFALAGKRYAGAVALAGLSGTWKITKSNETIDLVLQGNATARWSLKSSELIYDLAGTGFDRRISLARPVEILVTPDSGETIALTTLPDPIWLESDIAFWFRDLPVANGVFDGQTGVDGYTGDFDVRAANAFARGLYEWRLWSPQTPSQASDIPLWQGFVARPLRLHSVTVAAGWVSKIELLASLVAPIALDASGKSEWGETAPAQNLVLVTYSAPVPGVFSRTIERVEVNKGKLRRFTPAEIAVGRDRARFSVRPLVDVTWNREGDGVPRDGELTAAVRSDGWLSDPELSLKLFGQAVKFDKTSGASSGGSDASISFFPPIEDVGTIVLYEATLAWRYGKEEPEPATFTAAPSISLPFDGHDDKDLKLKIELGASRIDWLDAQIYVSWDADHDKASITIEGQGSSQSPVIGLGRCTVGATAIFAVLDNLKVSGFAQVWASQEAEQAFSDEVGDASLKLTAASTEDALSIRLVHAFQFENKVWSSDMRLDLSAQGDSTIAWPLGVKTTFPTQPDDEATTVSTAAVDSGRALSHRVTCSIRGAPVATTALDASGRLAEPWRLSMRTDHLLTAPDHRVCRWSSLDEVMIADLERLSGAARAGATARTIYGFGTRYGGIYRGQSSSGPPDMLRPGIFARSLVAAGFPDSLVEEALASAQPDGIALFGAGVSLFRLKSGDSLPLALPWLFGLGTAQLGPLASLPQAPVTGTKTWNTTWFDVRLSKVRGVHGGEPLALGDPSASRIAAQIEGGVGNAVMRPMLAAVEQPFFEDPAGTIAIAEAPLFLRSLVALAGAWDDLIELPNLQSRVIQPLVRRDGSCALFAASLAARPTVAVSQSRLVCIEDTTTKLLPPRADLDLISAASATSAVLATLHGALETPPLLFTVMTLRAFGSDADVLAAWREIDLSKRTIMAPPAWKEPVEPPLREPSDRLFVSASQGWPEAPAKRAVPDALALGENWPIQDEGTAIAGRSAAFASNAGGGPGQRPWISLRLQPLFDAMALPGVMAATPRQLDVVPRRPRLPYGVRQPNIVPSRFATIFVGYRPGAAHLSVTGLKELGGPIVDATARTIASRASYHPVLAGQDRMPRATKLPVGIENLDWRRETFVVPNGPKCRIEQVPAIAFRTYLAGSDPAHYVPSPRELVVLKAADGGLDLTRLPHLRLVVDGPALGNWLPYKRADFRLRVGTRTWPFTVVDRTQELVLSLQTAAAAEATALARDANGDTVIACELVLSASDQAAPKDEPFAAPNLILQLPLTVPRATEPVLAVPAATLIFGDPAYDRMLASMTASDTRRIGDELVILATDRQTYDLVSPILVSLGKTYSDKPTEYPGFNLTIQRFREGEKDPKTCQFAIPAGMAVASLSVDLMIAKGLVSVRPGDRLSLAAAFEDDSYSLGLQLTITREPSVPPAPAIYHLLTLHGIKSDALDAATALSASGPMPELVEYPALAGDLMAGYVRRRGLFVWHFAPDIDAYNARLGYLIKIDRSGAGQLPALLEDFEPSIAPPPPPAQSRLGSVPAPWPTSTVPKAARRPKRKSRKSAA